MSRSFAAAAALLLVAAAAGAGPALAQSESEFVAAFAGDWQSLEPALAAGGACRVTLGSEPRAGGHAASSATCAPALAGMAGWRISDGRLVLTGPEGAEIARLGGDQNRMSGKLADGTAVVFERMAASRSASAGPVEREAACLFYGYTASCAQAKDRQSPVPTGVDATARAAVLVELNMRAQASPDAAVVATIPAGTCVVVDQCAAASDGNWCRASLSSFSGWIRQQATRGGRWPVLTYAPGCAGAAR